jgi:ribulose-phosphate 3-epimerase
MKTFITPSILSADFGRLQDEVASVESLADWLQVDVMDGHFVPNLSFGAPVVKWIKTKLPLDIHLMVSNPADRVAEFQAIGAKNITFHAEAVKDTASRLALMKSIRSTGATAGIAINPETPVSAIDDVVEQVDLVLVMSVHPGFGGQMFIKDVLPKVEALRKKHPTLMIQIDGGIDEKTAALARAAGANNLVAGSALFSSSDRTQVAAALRG